MLPEIKTILYSSDLEPHAPGVFGYAVALAQRHGARIVMLHVIEPLSPTAEGLVSGMVPKAQLAEIHARGMADLRERIHGRLEDFRVKELASADVELVAEVRVVEGDCATTIMKQAEAVGADLIVVGTHGRAGMGEFMLGSVAHKLMQRCSTPVLMVPLRGLAA